MNEGDKMIGQEHLYSSLNVFVENNNPPNLILLIGAAGSGRKTIAKEFAQNFTRPSYIITIPDLLIDTVSACIENAYKATEPTIFIIPDLDLASIRTQNALLKITEEPPKFAKFIITAQNAEFVLDTIKSRAIVFYMDKYSLIELKAFANTINVNFNDFEDFAYSICEVPGDLQLLNAQNIEKFYNFCAKVYQSIGTVSGSNSFKIADNLALSDNSEGYDLKLFLRAFSALCFTQTENYRLSTRLDMIKCTSRAIVELNLKSNNKVMIINNWILKIREIILSEEKENA